jgi:hypothetical protein
VHRECSSHLASDAMITGGLILSWGGGDVNDVTCISLKREQKKSDKLQISLGERFKACVTEGKMKILLEISQNSI